MNIYQNISKHIREVYTKGVGEWGSHVPNAAFWPWLCFSWMLVLASICMLWTSGYSGYGLQLLRKMRRRLHFFQIFRSKPDARRFNQYTRLYPTVFCWEFCILGGVFYVDRRHSPCSQASLTTLDILKRAQPHWRPRNPMNAQRDH